MCRVYKCCSKFEIVWNFDEILLKIFNEILPNLFIKLLGLILPQQDSDQTLCAEFISVVQKSWK